MMEEREGFQNLNLRPARVELQILKFQRDLAAKIYAFIYMKVKAVETDVLVII